MRIAAERHGHGPTMLLIHPLGADRHVWDRVIDELGQERETIAVDLPGFGESPPLRGVRHDPAALAEKLAEWMAAEGIERPHAVGNSLGGWVALELAAMGAARAVSAIAPAGLWPRPLLPKPSLARHLARAALPLIGPVTSTAAGRRLLLSSTVAHPERVDAADAAWLIRSYATAPGFAEVNAAMRAGTFSSLAQITAPVTLIWPERDRLVARPRRLPSHIASVTLADAGHIPMLEDPQSVARMLLRASDPETVPGDGAPAAPPTARDGRRQG
jgi:pimeloyl-ACP methyl ester carboxylesterase